MQYSKSRIAVSISVVVAVVIMLHYLGWLSPIEHVFRQIVNKGAKPLYSLSIQNTAVSTTDDTNTSNIVIEELQTIIARLELEKDVLTEENDELRKHLNFFSSSTFSYIEAEIIGKNVDPVANTLIINKGTEFGIQIGDPVIAKEGIFIGKIARVERETAIVRLLQDGQSKVAATIRNEEKTLGIIEGGYGVSVQMNFIPQNETINIGDKIMTSGLEASVPRGLYIGTVEEVQKETYEPFQEAIVTPEINTQRLHIVSVITSKNIQE